MQLEQMQLRSVFVLVLEAPLVDLRITESMATHQLLAELEFLFQLLVDMEATLLQAVAQVEETLAAVPGEWVREISRVEAQGLVEMVEMMELAELEGRGLPQIYQWEVADQVVDFRDLMQGNQHPRVVAWELAINIVLA